MPLNSIDIPGEISELTHASDAVQLIELATDRIEAFMLDNDSVTENFVRCDFQLLDQSLTWIEQNQLMAGNRFCELGSGFGVAALLASLRGMESIGIEIESYLVDQAGDLADALDLSAEFYCGSFVPRGISSYEEIGLDMDDFDLFFAFPWPGEEHFFESVFEAGAADNSLLLTYRGKDGMHLVRKT